jgi:hypothetical protein
MRSRVGTALFVGAVLMLGLATPSAAQYFTSSTAFSASGACVNNVQTINYTVTPGGGDSSTTATLHFLDSSGTERLTLAGLPLSGSLPWPGIVLDGTGQPTDWPGWSFIGGTWTPTDDGFLWAQTASVFATTSSATTDTVALTYPGGDPDCEPADGFVPPAGLRDTEVEPETIVRGQTPPVGQALPRTGSDGAIPTTQIAVGFIGVGALAVVGARRLRGWRATA